jgi:tRNA(Ile2) C34 agmatinyltransferase TiaS
MGVLLTRTTAMRNPRCKSCGSYKVGESGRYGLYWRCRACGCRWLKPYEPPASRETQAKEGQ